MPDQMAEAVANKVIGSMMASLVCLVVQSIKER
jgi:hypothetical protein